MNFTEHTYEIWKIGKARNVDVGVAFDMFRADVKNGEARPYNTGDALPDFDFKAVKADWNAMTPDQQKEAYEEWHNFMSSEYNAVCKAFPEGPEAVAAVVKKWRVE